MSEAKLTLIGFQNYKELTGGDLFSQLALPEGVEKNTLVDNILLQGGEFEVIYSNPDFLERAIGVWSKKWYRTIDKWVKALNLEYNPLDNYDRTEEWEDSNTGTVTEQGSTSNTGTVTEQGSTSNTGTVKDEGSTSNTGTVGNINSETTGFTGHDETSNTAGSTTTNSKSAYDSATMQDTDRNVLSNSGSGESDTSNTTTVNGSSTRTDNLAGTSTNTRTDNLAGTSSNTRTDNLTSTNNSTRTDNLTGKHKGHIRGNIGVTTSMQLIESELSLAEWNLYEKITGLFLSEFVIPLY